MPDAHRDYYQRLREQIRDWVKSDEGVSSKWADYVLMAPDLFHLLWKLSTDREVRASDKVKLAGVLAYFISPLDLVPEGIVGPIGYLDDIALAAYVLNGMLKHTDPDVLRRHWAGDYDVLEVVKRVLGVADKMLSAKVLAKLKKIIPK